MYILENDLARIQGPADMHACHVSKSKFFIIIITTKEKLKYKIFWRRRPLPFMLFGNESWVYERHRVQLEELGPSI